MGGVAVWLWLLAGEVSLERKKVGNKTAIYSFLCFATSGWGCCGFCGEFFLKHVFVFLAASLLPPKRNLPVISIAKTSGRCLVPGAIQMRGFTSGFAFKQFLAFR